MPPAPDTPQAIRMPRRIAIGIGVGWFLIIIKCILAPWVMARWQVPIDPGWVIVPTLVLAGLATMMLYAHDWAPNER